jgi:hypothetical protein
MTTWTVLLENAHNDAKPNINAILRDTVTGEGYHVVMVGAEGPDPLSLP